MKPILMTSIFCLATFFVLGQTIEQKAFAQSYIYEKEEQYVKAIQAIEAVLDDKSYAHNLRLAWLHYLQSNFQKSKTLALQNHFAFRISFTTLKLQNL